MRINWHLSLFLEGSHNHPIRTYGNMTPLQHWLHGQLQYWPANLDITFDMNTDEYGINWNGPLPSSRFGGPNQVENDGITIPALADYRLDLRQELYKKAIH